METLITDGFSKQIPDEISSLIMYRRSLAGQQVD